MLQVRQLGTLACAAILGLLSVSPVIAVGETDPPGIGIGMEPVSRGFVLEEPVLVDMVIFSLRRKADFDLGEDCRSNLHLTIVMPDGAVQERHLPRTTEGGFDSECKISLQAGRRYERRLLLNEWYHFDKPGKYVVRLVLDSKPAHLEATATLEIGPRDPARLAEVCEDLASVANSFQAGPAMRAAKALSYVEDETCLPAMVRVLNESFHGKEGSIVALAHLGTAEAIQALVAAWDVLGRDQRALAFQELEKSEKQNQLREALAAARGGVDDEE